MTQYGTLTNQNQPLKIEFSSNSANGASSVNTAGSITVTSTCSWASRASYTPALQSAYPTDSNYLLISATQEQLPAGLCKLTLNYQATSTATPDTTYVEQSSQIEAPIQEHPDFDSWVDDGLYDANTFEAIKFRSGDALFSRTKYGINSYIAGTTTVTKTSYSTSKPSSERDSIGKLESPGGGYGSAANWLLIGANRAKQGAFWTLTKTYLYSAVAWDSELYSSV